MKKYYAGISLLESLLAIIIIASISMMAVRYYLITIQNNRINQAINQISRLTKASYEWLQVQHQADFSGTPSGTAISLDELLNDQLITNQTDTTDPWGGKISLSPGSDPSYIAISLENLPQKACKNISQQLKSINHLTNLGSCSNSKYATFIGEF